MEFKPGAQPSTAIKRGKPLVLSAQGFRGGLAKSSVSDKLPSWSSTQAWEYGGHGILPLTPGGPGQATKALGAAGSSTYNGAYSTSLSGLLQRSKQLLSADLTWATLG